MTLSGFFVAYVQRETEKAVLIPLLVDDPLWVLVTTSYGMN